MYFIRKYKKKGISEAPHTLSDLTYFPRESVKILQLKDAFLEGKISQTVSYYFPCSWKQHIFHMQWTQQELELV